MCGETHKREMYGLGWLYCFKVSNYHLMRQKRDILLQDTRRRWFIFVTLILGVVVLTGDGLDFLNTSDQTVLKPVESISHQHQNHIHGIGYDNQNQRLFVATHYGIFIWQDNKLFQLGENRDDFMGFSLHPTNPNLIYTSGHPAGGGNMGVMKSEDGGITFKPILAGALRETVDFHSMAISTANPNVLYGFFQGKLYLSKNGGNNWQNALARGLGAEGFCFGVPCLSAGVGVDPANPKRLLAFTKKLGLSLSQDGGRTWQAKNQGLKLSSQEFIFAFAFDARNPKHLFGATPESVFRSADGAESWKRLL